MEIRDIIEKGRATLGIEFGSTRIKAVLTDENAGVLASGGYTWENRYEDGIWTYHYEDIFEGLRACYAELKKNVLKEYGVKLKKLRSIGISAMMHGYLAFDKEGKLLVPFRTWRNTITAEAADRLTEAFGFNIPQRWSIAHLYRAILNKEEHVKDIAHITTLAGMVHEALCGRKVLGVGDASGMFPVAADGRGYDSAMLEKFDEMTKDCGFKWKLREILPEILTAGENAGILSAEGARLLDAEGELEAGALLAPPEGDAGTGMTATNSVAVRTGNVSAGTSVFAMIVLEKALKNLHREIDMVTTPSGDPVAMVHCNNCTSEINAWANMFMDYVKGLIPGLGLSEAAAAELAEKLSMDRIYADFYGRAAEGKPDCGGLLGYNYFSGEPVTDCEEGRPMFVRNQSADFSFANLARMQLYSACASLKYGLDILFGEEDVKLDAMYGHGGFFKTPEAGIRVMSAVMGCPVTVMQTAGEGGAWGIAILALYAADRAESATRQNTASLTHQNTASLTRQNAASLTRQNAASSTACRTTAKEEAATVSRDGAEKGSEEKNSTEIYCAEMNSTEKDSEENNSAEINSVEMKSTEVNSAEKNSTEIYCAEKDSEENSNAKINSVEMNNTEINSAEKNSTEIYCAEMNSTEKVSESYLLSLPEYLKKKIFAGEKSETVSASEEEVKGFEEFMKAYIKALPLERAASELVK